MCVSVNAIQWPACVQSSAFWADRYFIVQIVTLEMVHSREGFSFLWGQWYEATFDIRQQCKQGCQHGMQKDNIRCRDKENTDSTLQDPSPYIIYFVKEFIFQWENAMYIFCSLTILKKKYNLGIPIEKCLYVIFECTKR